MRKTRPKLEVPFKCYIYCTKDNTDFVPSKIYWKADNTGFQHILNGKVIGEFVCDRIRHEAEVADGLVDVGLEITSCVSAKELVKYAEGKGLYSWHISDLVTYDKPKELWDFVKPGYLTAEQLGDELCSYCSRTDYGEKKCYSYPGGYVSCEGSYCSEAYDEYLESECALVRAPQSWCYVDEKGR